MLQFFANGGFFMFLILLLGVAALSFNLKGLLRGVDERGQRLIFWLIAATFFCGFMGTGIGMYSAAMALPKMSAASLGKVLGIAATNVAFASMLCALNATLAGIVAQRSPKTPA